MDAIAHGASTPVEPGSSVTIPIVNTRKNVPIASTTSFLVITPPGFWTCRSDKIGAGAPPAKAPRSGEDAAVPAGDQRGDVGEDAGKLDAPGIGEVTGLPVGVEFLLVAAQPLEVVERLAVAEKPVADAAPGVPHRPRLQAREGRHPEGEPRVPLLLPPTEHAREEGFHRALRRGLPETHQIDRQLILVGGGPDVGEGHDLSVD